jgi:hypothetical protein
MKKLLYFLLLLLIMARVKGAKGEFSYKFGVCEVCFLGLFSQKWAR